MRKVRSTKSESVNGKRREGVGGMKTKMKKKPSDLAQLSGRCEKERDAERKGEAHQMEVQWREG